MRLSMLGSGGARRTRGRVMTQRPPCPVAPGPLEGDAARFDDPFTRVAQRRGFREYLAGLLAPRGPNKTLTALGGAQAAARAPHPPRQPLHTSSVRAPSTQSPF